MSKHNEPNDPNLHENWDSAHERRDVNTQSINRWMIYLFVVVLGSAFFLVWLFNRYEGGASRADIAPVPSADTVQLPPAPRLEANPMVNMQALRRHEDSLLGSYGVVDSTLGSVRIPIDSAIEIVLRTGTIPAMPMAPPTHGDSSKPAGTMMNGQVSNNESAKPSATGAGGT